MSSDMLDIQPRELRFTFEVKKQSSCLINLGNTTDQYVAFKVKTTSPKKYCVRPNTGIIKPKATFDFTVTMQAQSSAPPDLQCKDKFLILSTIVPFGTTEDDITSDMFAKSSGKHIEERKLRVVLLSPVQSPVTPPVNGVPKQDSSLDPSAQKDKVPSVVENLPPPQKKDVDFATVNTPEDSRPNKGTQLRQIDQAVNADESKLAQNVDSREVEDVDRIVTRENIDSKLKMIEDLTMKIDVLQSKLAETERTLLSTTDERRRVMREKDFLEQELAVVRRKGKAIYIGFPLLYLCMVAIVSLIFGYNMHE